MMTIDDLLTASRGPESELRRVALATVLEELTDLAAAHLARTMVGEVEGELLRVGVDLARLQERGEATNAALEEAERKIRQARADRELTVTLADSEAAQAKVRALEMERTGPMGERTLIQSKLNDGQRRERQLRELGAVLAGVREPDTPTLTALGLRGKV